MKLITAFLGLIRGLNLLFIGLTQVLFYYFILIPIFNDSSMKPFLHERLFFLLVTASVFIAAAGYIINDYFDLNIDRVNKPHKLVVEKVIKRRWAILWHLSLSAIGVLVSFYIGWKVNNLLIGFANLLCVALLWFYSTTFKRKLLIGNVIISLLSAWVVLVLYFSEWSRILYTNITRDELYAMTRVFRFAFLYAGFAFIISLIREVIKDIEDMPGDSKYGCRTMPIVYGVHVSKVFVSTWFVVLIASLGAIQFYVLQFRWWWSALYCFIMIILPLLYAFKKLYAGKTAEDFHQLSNLIKFVMLTGILSMIFFRIYS
ncbi:MAG: geranylgeranylglycerol-phosphate geranylgeranyltransferase [Chitinophagaceae bacterium]|nr:geranylgeranylglycerol-phosphate geranylgeranyltransferase [Chitinophagaceae bacterium]